MEEDNSSNLQTTLKYVLKKYDGITKKNVEDNEMFSSHHADPSISRSKVNLFSDSNKYLFS